MEVCVFLGGGGQAVFLTLTTILYTKANVNPFCVIPKEASRNPQVNKGAKLLKKSIGFAVFLRHGIAKALVFLCFRGMGARKH